MESQSSLEFKKLKFSYKSPAADKKPILEIDSFQIMKGEKVFLYGPSGCGKSTLLNLVAGVLKPTEGGIRVLGHDFDLLSSSKKDQIRGEKIGYIFQSFNLIPYLSVKENILLPLWMNKKVDTSKDNLGGILKSFTRYLVVDPPSLTNILHVTVDVRILANLKPTIASSEFDVNIVVFEFVICAPFDSKS